MSAAPAHAYAEMLSQEIGIPVGTTPEHMFVEVFIERSTNSHMVISMWEAYGTPNAQPVGLLMGTVDGLHEDGWI